MKTGQDTTLYVKSLSNGEWFGGWAPVQAWLEWLRPDGQAALFTITEEELEKGKRPSNYRSAELAV